MITNKRILLAILSLFFATGVIQECFSGEVASVASIPTGKGKNGEYVMPQSLAMECGIVLEDTDKAAADIEECLFSLLEGVGAGGERAKTAKGVIDDMVDESRISTLETMVVEKIYAANYKADVIDKFQEELSSPAGDSGLLGSMPGSSGGDSNQNKGHEIADWRNVAQADAILASQLNSHLNNVLATDIMHRALEYISGYNETYLENKKDE